VNVIEAIDNRKSIRGFKPLPVSPQILSEIVERALRAPSGTNTQCWEIAVVGGVKLDAIKSAFLQNSDKPTKSDIPTPLRYPEPWATRRSIFVAGVLAKLGIARENKEQRRQWNLNGYKLWGAKSIIYIMIDRSYYLIDDSINSWSVFDCGLIAQNILLLATEYGLGSIPAIQPVLYPDIIRKVLGLPDSKLLVLGLPIGYPDWEDPVNQFRSEREPLDKVAKFYMI
jgi:nitroreductase